MNKENEMLIKEIVGSIRQLARAVYLDSSKINRHFGLTGAQSSVLRTLSQHGPLSSAQLSRKLFVTPSNITGIIDRLAKKGLVERIRKKGDRRVVLITLVEKGQEMSNDLPDPIEKKLISGLADLSPDAVQNLGQAMNQLVSLVGAEELADTPLELNRGPNVIGENGVSFKT